MHLNRGIPGAVENARWSKGEAATRKAGLMDDCDLDRADGVAAVGRPG